MPWINHTRINKLREEILALNNNEPSIHSENIKKTKETPKQLSTWETWEATPANKSEAQSKEKGDLLREAYSYFEDNIATKLPVWIGAVSLICAGFFLMKYSIELGWMKPAVRTCLGAIFGFILLGFGHYIINRPHIANAKRMGQALLGSGIVTIYVCVYAAVNLYGLIPSITGFALMAAITVAAVLVSLIYGQPIAVFGLVGGLLTPALIGSDDPNAIAMFIYLFALFALTLTIFTRNGWWKLSLLALAGVFSWSGFFAFTSADALILIIFAIAVVTAVLIATSKIIMVDTSDKEKRYIHGMNLFAVACGVLTIGWVSVQMTLTLFDWSMFGLLSLALMFLAYFQPHIYQKAFFVKMMATIILFYIWANNAILLDNLIVLAWMIGIYIIGAAFMMRRVHDPRFWAFSQIIAGLSLYLVSYFSFDLSQPLWATAPFALSELTPTPSKLPFDLFWGFVAFVLSIITINQISDIYKKYHADTKIREHLLAIYVLAASAIISLGLAIELPWSYIPLAISAQIAATAFVNKYVDIKFLSTMLTALALLFTAMHFEQIILFALLSFLSLMGETPFIGLDVLKAPLFSLGLPTIFLSLALWLSFKAKNVDKKIVQLLSAIIIGSAMALFYYLVRGLPLENNWQIFTIFSSFVERGIITVSLAIFAVALFRLSKLEDMSFVKSWARILIYITMFRLIYFDLFLYNPLIENSQIVGDMLFLNGVTLTYGFGTLLFAWSRNNDYMIKGKKLFQAMSFIFLFALITLTIRQFFHGSDLTSKLMSSAELYSYSVIWLIMGLGLLTWGIKKTNKTIRLASLAFITLAILKVFLYDSAELNGLYRVFSFLGLGICLIGLSYIYSKFVITDIKKK